MEGSNRMPERPVVSLARRAGAGSAVDQTRADAGFAGQPVARIASRPLLRRAARLARLIGDLGESVAAARNRIRVPRLGERVAAAREPKLLRSATRLAPARRVTPATRPPRPPSAPRAARVVARRRATPARPAVGGRGEVAIGETIYTGLGWDDAQGLSEAVAPALGEAAWAGVGEAAVSAGAFSEGPANEAAVSEGPVSEGVVSKGVVSEGVVSETAAGAEPSAVLARSAQPGLRVAEPEPIPPGLPEDMHYLWQVWQQEKPGGRGWLERSRGARILEGASPKQPRGRRWRGRRWRGRRWRGRRWRGRRWRGRKWRGRRRSRRAAAGAWALAGACAAAGD